MKISVSEEAQEIIDSVQAPKKTALVTGVYVSEENQALIDEFRSKDSVQIF